MSYEFEIQKSVEKALRSRRTLTNILASEGPKRGIYDRPPQPLDAGNNDPFPYVTLGKDVFFADDTDTTNGIDGLITIHCWSRQPGYSECKRINDEIRRELHHAELDIFGVNLTTINYQSSEMMDDPDGTTTHGVIQFRILATIL